MDTKYFFLLAQVVSVVCHGWILSKVLSVKISTSIHWFLAIVHCVASLVVEVWFRFYQDRQPPATVAETQKISAFFFVLIAAVSMAVFFWRMEAKRK
ncbi:MAG: hypothetical protein BGO21_02580 [Dyadobacter sp. 50-39]|nr:MAG: hypothetical protein BGO21_02580 [Dyadobacter sp. 50-39]